MKGGRYTRRGDVARAEPRKYREPPGERRAQVIKLPRNALAPWKAPGPYRKPTQVGGESIPRRSSESWPRN